MDSLRRVLALAAFETRLNMRMIRGWILGILASLLGLGSAAYYLVLHRLFSGYSAPWAFLTSDLWVLQSAVNLGLVLGLLGIFLTFDWRHRDQSAHFAGTLDASPLTRLEHAWGKFLGLWLVVTWPLLVLLVGQIIGMAISGVWLPPIVFLVSFGLHAVPFALAPVAVAFGLAGLFRNQALARALAILLGIGWIVLVFGAGFGMPEKYAVIAGTLTELPFHSDFVGYEAGALTLLQRVSNFAQVAFFACLAALGPLGLPRDSRERGGRILITAALAAAWLLCLGAIHVTYTRADADRRAILAAEESARASRTPLVVLRRDLVVKLEPGRSLEGVAKLRVRPDGAWPSHALLRLNAGLDVKSVSVGGSAASFERDHTVLRVPLPALGAAADTVLEIAYGGRPTIRSVDAGAALAEAEMSAQDRNNRRFLGNIPMFFDRSSVVLGMDAAWYPDTALVLGARYPDIERADLAPGSLSVTMPEGWKAASVGASAVEEGRTAFTSEVAVPGFGLVAAKYEEAATSIDGIKVRLLYLEKHRRNVEFFADAKEQLVARAQERLGAIRSATGLAYPHPELCLVDVPQLIGVHASGWDSANRLGQPGVVMLREGQFFRARFEHALKTAKDKWTSRSGGGGPAKESSDAAPKPVEPAPEFDAAKTKVEILERFTGTDFTGGDVERLVLRSMWDHRVKPMGPGSALVGVALPSFVAEVALGRYVADTPETARVIQSAANETIQLYANGRTNEIGEVIMKAVADPDAVWALMQETPLDRLEPAGKPAEFAGVMFVKGRQPFLAVRDALGREAVSAVLADLLAQAASAPLTWSAVRASVLAHAAPERVGDLERLFDAWLAGTELPGFIVERGRAFRLPGETEAWQAVAVVSNRGTGAGTARLSFGEGDAAIRRLVSVPMGGSVEVALVSPTKPERWSLQPYLALNRTAPSGSLDVLDTPEWETPLDVTREAPAPAKPILTVDNVDPGFKVLVDGESIGWHDRDEKAERRLGNIPVLWRAPGTWRRWTARAMSPYRPFGYFDESAAVKKGTEKGESPASWTIDLPQPGRWRVSAYLPAGKAGEGAKVSNDLTFVVRHGSGEQVVELKLDAAKAGWNDLGPFDFASDGEVRLLDKGDGVIIADAVRFTKE